MSGSLIATNRANGRDLPLLKQFPTDKKIAIGVVNHSTAAVEPPEFVANLIRRALEYVPVERLILASDCGFGREGLSRRIAFYKSVAMGIDWMSEEDLNEAIPPAYTRFVGEHLMKAVRGWTR